MKDPKVLEWFYPAKADQSQGTQYAAGVPALEFSIPYDWSNTRNGTPKDNEKIVTLKNHVICPANTVCGQLLRWGGTATKPSLPQLTEY